MDTAQLPFSPARTAGNLVFLSGQGGFVPESGELAGSSIEAQTEQTLHNTPRCSGSTIARSPTSCRASSTFPTSTYAAHVPEPRPVRTGRRRTRSRGARRDHRGSARHAVAASEPRRAGGISP
jgi:hypothetical protein